jgi:hypothetical protein
VSLIALFCLDTYQSCTGPYSFIHSFIHSIGMCRMWQFLAVLWSFFHSSLLHTFSCHSSPPTILQSSLTSSYHLFLGIPFCLLVPKFMYNTLLGIIFSSILCTCPNHRNLCSVIFSVVVGFLTIALMYRTLYLVYFFHSITYLKKYSMGFMSSQ